MSIMGLRVTCVGHSYVRRLMEYRMAQGDNPDLLEVDGRWLELSYVHKGGENYAFFNRSPQYRQRIVQSNPDIVLVVLGGNAVGSGVPIPEASREMRDFHFWMRKALPNAIIVIAECEPRYNTDCEIDEEDLAPLDEDGVHRETFWSRRNAFNQAVNRTKLKDFTLRTARYLNRREFYGRWGVHFNDRGNRFYWGMVKDCLAKVIIRFNL